MVNYNPLWHTLLNNGMKKTDLITSVPISTATLAKLSSNKYVSLEIIDKICYTLQCPIEDVVEIKNSTE